MSEIEALDREKFIENLKFDDNGLVPAIIQDAADGTVLMLGYMNKKSVYMTFEKGLATFWSRSRQKYWTKGETSGHHLKVEAVYTDCDRDTILVKATPAGPTCHTNKRTCFSWQAV